MGMKATHLQLTQNVNQPFVTGDVYGSTRPSPSLLRASSPILPVQCTAPNPACPLGTINQVNSGGNSNYNALWVTVNKDVLEGLPDSRFLHVFKVARLQLTLDRRILYPAERLIRVAITGRRSSTFVTASC